MTNANVDEAQRQATIVAYKLGDRGTDPFFDDVTRLASDLFSVSIAVVTVLAADEQLFRGACGIDTGGTDREVAFCNHTIRQSDVFVVEDAATHPRFRDNPLVTGPPFIRFYAGAPIRIGGGVAVGSLCLIDQSPRSLSDEEKQRLLLLTNVVRELMELRVGSLLARERGQALERQAELLRATFDNVEQGIALFDQELRLVLWNQLFFDLLEFGQEHQHEGTWAPDLLLIAAERGDFGKGDPRAIVGELVESIASRPSRRIELHRADGTILEAWRAALPDGRSILTVEDVTEHRNMIRIKDQFVSTVSHELRTPLTSIIGSLALLDRTMSAPIDPRTTQLTTIAKQNAARLATLIDDILDVEKLGSGGVQFLLMRTDLAEMVVKAVEQNRPYAAALDVDLKLERIDAPLMVQGDADRLIQALTNLISNAAKFSPPGAIVTIRGEARDGRAIISVEDRGAGIPVEFRPRLFQRFSQAGRSKQRGRSGTGLGLAITKAIIDRHGGKIDFDTEIGTGTRFWFEIPLKENEGE